MVDEVSRARCKKCDYMNPAIAIDKKKMACRGYGVGDEGIMGCEIYMKTIKLKNRMDYLSGKAGPLFICGEELEIEFFD